MLLTGKKKAFRSQWRTGLLLALGMTLLLLLPASSLSLRGVDGVCAAYRFQVPSWELMHFPSKWLYKLWDLRPGAHRHEDERNATILRYFELADEVSRLESRVGQAAAQADLAGSQGRQALETQLADVRKKRDALSLPAQEAIEGVVDSIFHDQGLGSRFGLLFPPVDFTFDDSPYVLVTAPRDKMVVKETVLLRANVSVSESEQIEAAIQSDSKLSAIVEPTGGLAMYPAVVAPDYGIEWTLQTVAHEWTHQYLYFRPLGRGYFSGPDMVTLNETVANIVGDEIGRIAYERVTGDPLPVPATASPAPATVPANTPPLFNFNTEMRKTRLEAEAMLAAGRIDEAEAYMEARRQLFVQQGYAIRKLNQAYFAFHGSYADSAQASSPILGQLRQLRKLSPSLVAFLNSVGRAGSYAQFVTILGDTQDRDGSAPAATTP